MKDNLRLISVPYVIQVSICFNWNRVNFLKDTHWFSCRVKDKMGKIFLIIFNYEIIAFFKTHFEYVPKKYCKIKYKIYKDDIQDIINNFENERFKLCK